MDEFLEQLVSECALYTQKGTVASYIPELSKVEPNVLGVHIVSSDREVWRQPESH